MFSTEKMTCRLLERQTLRASHTAIKWSLMGHLSLEQWDMKQEYMYIHDLESIDMTVVNPTPPQKKKKM